MLGHGDEGDGRMAQREKIISVKVNATEEAQIKEAAQDVALPVSSFARTVLVKHIRAQATADRKASR